MGPLLHSSKRRPSLLKPEDYDHEIDLVDHTRQSSASPVNTRTETPSIDESLTREDSIFSSPTSSEAPLRKKKTPQALREEIARRKYGKYQDNRLQAKVKARRSPNVPAAEDVDIETGEDDTAEDDVPRGRTPKKKPEPDSDIDILYENQRGGFLCGMALFSGRALGSADPAPWTNSANKTSATDITNAQVPDPSWEWAWKEWKINLTDEVDEDGWEYSFMFAKAFSWHDSAWWNSFVRRRAWIRKRVRRQAGYKVNQAHMLNPDYFTIHPAEERSRSPTSTTQDHVTNRYSAASLAKRDMEEVVFEDVSDISALMKALRLARIDREKMEAVENFLEHGGDDLYYLQNHMHEIMRMFIFQASRRLLLSHLLKVFNEASDKKKQLDEGNSLDEHELKRLGYLEAAVQHADEEVKRLEFWSDVKDMAEKGETHGAVDEEKGWGEEWTGIDVSAPKDVKLERKLELHSAKEQNYGNGNGTVGIMENGKEKAHSREQEKGTGLVKVRENGKENVASTQSDRGKNRE